MTTTRIEQFVTTSDEAGKVAYSGSYVDLEGYSERNPAVGRFGADNAIVLVLLDVNDDHRHVLVDADQGDEVKAMTAAIEKLTIARDRLVRLQAA